MIKMLVQVLPRWMILPEQIATLQSCLYKRMKKVCVSY